MSGPTELEGASLRAGSIAHHAALIALAAEGAYADGETDHANKFMAGALAIEEQMEALRDELYRLSKCWLQERRSKAQSIAPVPAEDF